MKKHITTLLLVLHMHITCTPQKGIICVPVADLIGEQLTNNAYVTYETLPECPAKNSSACPRLHQALFNEVVTIMRETEREVQIKVHNCFFNTHNSETKHATYWTKKENVLLFSTLQKKNIAIKNVIPEPIDYLDNTHHGLYNEVIIGLKKPHYDKHLGMHFSAGTRFLLTENQPKRTSHWLVYAINPKTLKKTTLSIAKNKCIRQQKNVPHEQKIALFVALLDSWTKQKKGVIPYVWGGCSMAVPVQENFTHKNIDSNDYYTYQKNKRVPKAGFDCAGLILRAAQLAGLEYFYKNTTTISQHLGHITSKDIRAGDIIWVPGHVMIVHDTKKNTLIEARGYDHGYGKVQTINLNKVFKSVDSYETLANELFAHRPLIRINDRGDKRNVFKNYMVLRI